MKPPRTDNHPRARARAAYAAIEKALAGTDAGTIALAAMDFVEDLLRHEQVFALFDDTGMRLVGDRTKVIEDSRKGLMGFKDAYLKATDPQVKSLHPPRTEP